MSGGNSLILLVFIALAAFILSAQKQALATETLGERTNSSQEALISASAFSFDTRGVGIVMSYGTDNNVSAEAIGDQFVTEIRKRGFDARYFYYTNEKPGMAMAFHLRYSSLGPWNVDVAASNLSNIVKRAESARWAHGN